jgi:hypothetical protein
MTDTWITVATLFIALSLNLFFSLTYSPLETQSKLEKLVFFWLPRLQLLHATVGEPEPAGAVPKRPFVKAKTYEQIHLKQLQ